MGIDKKELENLSPEERIKRLKLMEEDRKKEVDEIESLIKKVMQELKTRKLADEIAPEQRPVNISQLFENSKVQKLERTLRESSKGSTLDKSTKWYQVIAQTYQDYSQLKKFYSITSTGGSLTEEQIAAIGQIGERLNIAEKYISEGEKVASKLDSSRTILYKLKKETGLD